MFQHLLDLTDPLIDFDYLGVNIVRKGARTSGKPNRLHNRDIFCYI